VIFSNNYLIERYSKSSGRSKEAARNIVLSFFAKVFSVISSMLIVPLTIHYVNPTQYGIWLTLSSIIGWILLFDFGLGNGLRNKFAEAMADEDKDLARQYVSTTYFTLGIIMLVLFIVIAAINQFVNWSDILKLDVSYAQELKQVFAIVAFFFCTSLVVNLFSTILTANQKSGLSAVLGAIGQIVSLLVIYILTLTTEGSLFNLALYYSGVPMLVVLLASVYGFGFTHYKDYVPKLQYYRKNLVKSVTSLGLKFFIICISMIFIFQMMNIIISRELGPDAVTEYNIAFKYFNILTTIVIIIVTPFWSAFTDAYHKKDYIWMAGSMKKLEKVWLISCLATLVMIFLANLFYRVWVGKDLVVQMSTTVSIAVYVTLYNLGQIYMYMINGIGTVRIQLIIFLIFAMVAWPLMVVFCRWYGLPGIVFVPSVVVILQAIFGKMQIGKIISGTAIGLWGK
jgi:O-antigen/teichoic acid export membrane protein